MSVDIEILTQILSACSDCVAGLCTVTSHMCERSYLWLLLKYGFDFWRHRP